MRLLIVLMLSLPLVYLPWPVQAQSAPPASAAPATASDPGMPAALAPPPKFLARDLQAACQAAGGSVQLRGCLRYIQGAAAMYNLAAGEGKDPGWFCTPRDAPAEMLRQQFVGWAQDNADQMGIEAIQALRQSLADSYPCQE